MTEGIIEEKKCDVKSTPGYSIYKSNAKTESSLVTLVSVEADELDVQIKSMMTRTENESKNGKSSACNVCGKEDWISNIKTHIESNHIERNISHSCEICGKVSRTREGLRKNKYHWHHRLQAERKKKRKHKSREHRALLVSHDQECFTMTYIVMPSQNGEWRWTNPVVNDL